MKLLAAGVFLLGVLVLRAEPEYPKLGPDIYDTKVEGASLVENAIVTANATHRRIILDFGANWCVWCRRLHATFESDADVKKALQENFVLVMVDANNREGKDRNASLNKYYENPLKEGLPVLVVLEKDGRQLKIQDTAKFENGKGGHDPQKIVAFLNEWAPKK